MDSKSRTNILRTQFKCFLCIKGGHRSLECRSEIYVCSVKVNISNKLPKEAVKDAQPLNLETSSWKGSTCPGNTVDLQTALANAAGKDSHSVRVLTLGVRDHSSLHRLFEHLGLVPMSRETLHVQSFGSGLPESKIRDSHYSTKKQYHVLTIMKNFFSSDTRQSMKRRIVTDR